MMTCQVAGWGWCLSTQVESRFTGLFSSPKLIWPPFPSFTPSLPMDAHHQIFYLPIQYLCLSSVSSIFQGGCVFFLNGITFIPILIYSIQTNLSVALITLFTILPLVEVKGWQQETGSFSVVVVPWWWNSLFLKLNGSFFGCLSTMS